MVELLNDANLKRAVNLLSFFFNIQKSVTHVENINYPTIKSCIYALWHGHQFCLFGLKNYSNTNVLISNSTDGELIAQVINKVFGFKLARGSSNRQGAVEATMKMIDLLKKGECAAITVDGPRGPQHVVKKGIIKIAKLSGAPIVPVTWYSSNPNWFKLPSWDRMEVPLGRTRIVNLYGEPLYVPQDGDEESDKNCRLELQKRMLELEEQAPKEFDKIYWHGLWKRKQ